MSLLDGMPHGHLMAGLRQERAAQERIRARALAVELRCQICQEDFRPGERRTYLDGEICHVQCVLDEFGVSVPDQLPMAIPGIAADDEDGAL